VQAGGTFNATYAARWRERTARLPVQRYRLVETGRVKRGEGCKALAGAHLIRALRLIRMRLRAGRSILSITPLRCCRT